MRKIYISAIQNYNIYSVYLETRNELCDILSDIIDEKEEICEDYGFEYGEFLNKKIFYKSIRNIVVGNVLNQITKKKLILLKTPGLSMDVKEYVSKFIF